MGNRPYQEPFTPDSSGSLPVSQVWHDFRRHERALARLGTYLDDVAATASKDHPRKYLNKLKGHVIAQLRELERENRVQSPAVAVDLKEIKDAVEWLSLLTLEEAEELASDYVEEDEPKRPYALYVGLVVVGGLLEYLITHWLHR